MVDDGSRRCPDCGVPEVDCDWANESEQGDPPRRAASSGMIVGQVSTADTHPPRPSITAIHLNQACLSPGGCPVISLLLMASESPASDPASPGVVSGSRVD